MSDQSHDRFTLPRDIPDAAYWAGGATHEEALRRRDAARAEDALRQAQDDKARGYKPSHPAGRGWVPQSRRLGFPEERCSWPCESYNGVEYEFPGGTPDDLVAKLGGSEVFTLERRVRFLDNLAFKGNVRAAAALVNVSHETAYRKRRQEPMFAALWDAALIHARTYAESQLATAALDGVEVPIVHRGEIVGYVRKHDARLRLAHLGRLDKLAEADSDEARAARARAPHFDALLAGYAGHEAPEGFAEAAAEALDWRERDGAAQVPPTREDYLIWARSRQAGGRSARAEAGRMAEAAEAAGAAWDAWHEAALEVVGRLVDPASVTPADAGVPLADLDEGQLDPGVRRDDEEGGNGDDTPLPPAGGAGGGPVARASDMPTPNPSRKREGEAGEDLPYEIKSALTPNPRDSAARNRVTPVNPPRCGHGSPHPAETGSSPAVGGSRGGAGLLTPPSMPAPSLPLLENDDA